MMNQLKQLFISQFKELSREPSVLFWGIGLPILMSWGLGIAFTKKNDTSDKVAVVGMAMDSTANQKNNLIFFMKNRATKKTDGEIFEYTHTTNKVKSEYQFILTDWDQAQLMLKRGIISLILEKKDEDVLYHYDPANAAGELLYHKVSLLLNNKLFMKENNSRPLLVKGTRYIDFLIPGVMALGIMMSCMWGIGYSLIEKRRLKLLRRMIATPMKKSSFLASTLIVRLIVNFVETLVLFLFATLYFSIEVQGNIWALFAVFFAGNIAFSGIAIFVASRTNKSEVGNGLINLIVTPMMILSGIFFNYQNFPDWGVTIIKHLPLSLMADGMKAIFNEGAGFSETIREVLILISIGFVFFLGGLKIFKWY